MKSPVIGFGFGLLLLCAIDARAAAAAKSQEGCAWHLRTVELQAGHDGEVKTNEGVWRDLHADSLTGRVWNAQLVDAGGRTNCISFASSCTLPPKVVKPDTELRFCLTATCESACTGRTDRVFVKWNSGNENDPRPDEAFQLVDGERLPGVGTNGLVLCADGGRPRAVSGVYAKVLPPGDRRGRKRDLVFVGSGALTKWTYEWDRIDEGKSGTKRNSNRFQRVLAANPELKKALEDLAAKDDDFWDACSVVLPEEEEKKEEETKEEAKEREKEKKRETPKSSGGGTREKPSFFLRLLKWLFYLSLSGLVGFVVWKKRLLSPENLQKLWQRIRVALVCLGDLLKRIPWKRIGEQLLHFAQVTGHYLGIVSRCALANARKGYAWLRRKYEERRKPGKDK